jgi:AcrR family transcriptional regulator
MQQQKYTVESTRKRILKEAEILFAAKGFEGTGIEEIARNVGIRKSVIYYHFENKGQILQILLDEFVAEGVAFKKGLFERYEKTFTSDLYRIVSEMIDFLSERWRIVTILLMESLKNPSKLPLLNLWNFQSPATQEVVASAEGHHIDIPRSITHDAKAMHEAFFMLSLPFIGYTVFADKWCEHMGYDKKKSRDNFVDSCLWYLRERMMKGSEGS